MSVERRQQDNPASAAFPIVGGPPAAGPAGRGGVTRLTAALILAAGAGLGVWAAWMGVEAPRTRDIHIEAYRYGFSPARIHANRGDRLRLTFSTRDTGQSFFFQDYDLHVAITPGDRTVAVERLSRPGETRSRVETVEIVAGSPGWLVSKSQFRNHTYNGPGHGTERGELLVGPNFLLYGALGLLLAMPLAGVALAGRRPARATDGRVNLFGLWPWLKRVMKAPSFQFNLTLPMLGVFWLIILAGLFGTKVSGRNAGPMVIWVLWLSALIIVLVPVGGRIWCTVCPLPVAGEWMQRRRLLRNPEEIEGRQRLRILGVPMVWPRWLEGAWPRVVFFLLLGTFSTTIVAVPAATSWMLIVLMAMAVLTGLFPEQRLFCRHLCPINAYISLYSTTGRVMVRAVNEEACAAKCAEKFCLTGSIKGWGCPYGLCVEEIDRNNDCGLCMECVKTCAYDNVGLYWRKSEWDREVASYGEAWQAMVMFALACLYCVINLGAWDRVRDWIDLVDKGNWGTFGLYAAAVWAACLGVLPFVWYVLTRAGMSLGGTKGDAGRQFRATSAALAPLGLAVWMGFALATLLSMKTFVLQSLSDPFNWGWDLLGTAGSRWHIVWAPAIPWLQVAFVVVGLGYALGVLRRCWPTVKGAAPLGLFVWGTAAGMVWFFAG